MFKKLDFKTVIEFNPIVVGLFHIVLLWLGGAKKPLPNS